MARRIWLLLGLTNVKKHFRSSESVCSGLSECFSIRATQSLSSAVTIFRFSHRENSRAALVMTLVHTCIRFFIILRLKVYWVRRLAEREPTNWSRLLEQTWAFLPWLIWINPLASRSFSASRMGREDVWNWLANSCWEGR